MDQSLEVTNIKKELTDSTTSDRVKIPIEMQLNSVKQESDCLVQSAIYIKTEPQEDENEFPAIAGTSHEICGSDVTKYTKGDTNEPMIKIECNGHLDKIMQDPLDVNSEIKVENHFLSDLESQLKIKTEPTGEEKHKYLLETDMDDSHESESNQDQDQRLFGNEVYKRNKIYVCNVCNRTFTLKCNLNVHLRIHTGERPFTCNICVKSFNQKSTLNIHMLIHTGEKSHTCDVCKKAFRHRSHFNEHKLIHSGVKPFSCNVCSKSFTHKNTLVTHERMHTGDKPYACDVCSKAFKERSNLNKHKRTHTGEKPYTCDICKKSFADKSTLNRHKKTHKN